MDINMDINKTPPFANEFVKKSELIPNYLTDLDNNYNGFEFTISNDSLIYFKKYKYNKYRCKYYLKGIIFLNRFFFKNYFLNKKGKILFEMDLFSFEQLLKVYTLLKNILFLDTNLSIEWESVNPIFKQSNIKSTSNLINIESGCVENYLKDLNHFYNGFKLTIIEYNILHLFKFAKAEYGYRYKVKLTIFYDRYKSTDFFKNKQGVFNFEMELFDFQQVLDMNRLLKNIFYGDEVTIKWRTFTPFG